MGTPAGCLQETVRTNPAGRIYISSLFNLHIEPSYSPPATSSWIQVNLGQTRKVTGIVVQGCPQNDFWLTEFKIQHSVDGTRWTDYTADGQVSEPLPPDKAQRASRGKLRRQWTRCHFQDFHHLQFFSGSTDRDGPVTQLLGTPVSTQHVRILPLGFSGQAGLRFDVLGCTPDCKGASELKSSTVLHRWSII